MQLQNEKIWIFFVKTTHQAVLTLKFPRSAKDQSMKQFALKHDQQLHFFFLSFFMKLQISLGTSICQFSFFLAMPEQKKGLVTLQ